MTEQTKRCSKCGEVKALYDFHKNRQSFDGLHNQCKHCRYVINAKYLADNPEKMKSIWAKYRENNREKERVRNAKYRVENNEKRKAISDKYREDMAPSYVAMLCCIKTSELTTEIIEAKRQQLMLHRIGKQIKQVIKEQTK